MKKEDILLGFLSVFVILFLSFGTYYYITEIKPLQEGNPAKTNSDDNSEKDEWQTKTLTDDNNNNYTLRVNSQDGELTYEVLNDKSLVLLTNTGLINEDYLIKDFAIKIYNIPSSSENASYLGIEYLDPLKNRNHEYEIISITNDNVKKIVNIGRNKADYVSILAEDNFKNYIIDTDNITFIYTYGCNPQIDELLTPNEEIYYLRLILSELEYDIQVLVSPYPDLVNNGATC